MAETTGLAKRPGLLRINPDSIRKVLAGTLIMTSSGEDGDPLAQEARQTSFRAESKEDFFRLCLGEDRTSRITFGQKRRLEWRGP